MSSRGSRSASTSSQARAVLATELRALSRDRRALFSAIVLPMLLYPLLFFGQHWLERLSKETLDAKHVTVALDLSRAPSELAVRFEELLALELPIATQVVDASALQELEPELSKGTPQSYERERTIVQRVFAGGADALVVAMKVDEAPYLELRAYHDGTQDLSNEASQRVERARRAAYAELSKKRIAAVLGVDPARGLAARTVDVASSEDQSGAALGRLLPMIAVLVLLSGGAYAALSAFAGEREGGTLETLLVQPVSSRAIVAGKFAAVLVTAIATLAFNGASILACLALGVGRVPGLAAGAEASLTLGAGRLALAAFVFLPAVVLLCAALCVICGRARTFREGQHLLLPLMLVALVPTLLASMQDVELDVLLAAVPLAGPALAVRDALRGTLAVLPAAWMFVASSAWAGVALARVGGVLDAERVLATKGDENEDARRKVQSRTAVRWAVTCVFAIYLVGGALQSWKTIPGLVLTLAVLVPALAFGSIVGTARRAKESIARALQLRAPNALHLAGAALLVPAMVQVALRLFEWQERVIPLPVGAGNESLMNEVQGLAPIARVLVLAVLPALAEELFFRGALYSGLKRDLPTWRCAAYEFLLFGAAHAMIYRFLPTGLLGAVLTFVVARSRSLWPCVVLHAGYNAWIALRDDVPALEDPRWAWLALLALPCFLARPRA